MDAAPFHHAVAEGPEAARALWLRTADGVRIRIAVWPAEPARGTVLVLPGRTEFVEKYARTAAALGARGYAAIAVDWRGQGLSDRPLRNPTVGHVRRFAEYQADLRAMVEAAERLALPRPFHLLGHSMGGCIGLRALHERLPVVAAAFSAPMWDIVIEPTKRTIAWALSTAARPVGLGHRVTPGTEGPTYVLSAAFEGNRLTRDAEQFAFMQRQLDRHPELQVGGPSLAWLNAALREMRALRTLPPPPVPVYVGLGTAERIVNVATVRAVAQRWPGAVLDAFEEAEHELLMERPHHRERFLDRAADLFGDGAARGGPRAAG